MSFFFKTKRFVNDKGKNNLELMPGPATYQYEIDTLAQKINKSIKLNNFDYGKTTIKKAREEIAFGRNNS